MQEQLTRRDFSPLLSLGTAAGPALFAANSARKLKIGHTGITWDNDSEAAVRDVSALGYYGFETICAKMLTAVLDLVEKGNMQGMIMVELDSSPHMPIAAGETARIAKSYLQKPGCTFRS